MTIRLFLAGALVSIIAACSGVSEAPLGCNDDDVKWGKCPPPFGQDQLGPVSGNV